MKLQTKNPMLVHAVGAAAVVALTGLLVLFVIVPIWKQRGERSRLAGEVTSQISERDRLERVRRMLSTQVTSTNEAAERAALALKSPGELNQQLALIADLAAATGVQVETLAPGAAVSNVKFRVLPIRLSGRANYLATTRFFETIRQQLPDTSIRSFQMQADNSANSPSATISMELLWCTKPDVVSGVSSTK